MSTDLRDLSRADVIRSLEEIVFNGARDWKRLVVIDRETRDWIVTALKETRLPTMAASLARSEAAPPALIASHQDREGS